MTWSTFRGFHNCDDVTIVKSREGDISLKMFSKIFDTVMTSSLSGNILKRSILHMIIHDSKDV